MWSSSVAPPGLSDTVPLGRSGEVHVEEALPALLPHGAGFDLGEVDSAHGEGLEVVVQRLRGVLRSEHNGGLRWVFGDRGVPAQHEEPRVVLRRIRDVLDEDRHPMDLRRPATAAASRSPFLRMVRALPAVSYTGTSSASGRSSRSLRSD